MTTAAEFPPCLADLLEGCSVRDRRRGRLGATIIRIGMPNGTGIYLKIASLASAEDLRRESECLSWLQGRLPVPPVICYTEHQGWAFLALPEAAGECSHESLRPLPETVELLGETLRTIHALETADFPFRETLEDELTKAGGMLAKGWIDSAAFEAANGGRSPESVYDELLSTRDLAEDLTFTHGDYAMPNVLVESGRVTSILDWASARLGNRHRDFVVMRDSLIRNCPGDWMETFLAAYGEETPDPRKMKFYGQLDQLFSHASIDALSPAWPGAAGH